MGRLFNRKKRVSGTRHVRARHSNRVRLTYKSNELNAPSPGSRHKKSPGTSPRLLLFDFSLSETSPNNQFSQPSLFLGFFFLFFFFGFSVGRFAQRRASGESAGVAFFSVFRTALAGPFHFAALATVGQLVARLQTGTAERGTFLELAFVANFRVLGTALFAASGRATFVAKFIDARATKGRTLLVTAVAHFLGVVAAGFATGATTTFGANIFGLFIGLFGTLQQGRHLWRNHRTILVTGFAGFFVLWRVSFFITSATNQCDDQKRRQRYSYERLHLISPNNNFRVRER